MNPEKIIDMMNFIDYFYETIPDIYGGEPLLVSLKDGEWKVTTEMFENSSTEPSAIVTEIVELHGDLGYFESLLQSKVCIKGVLHRKELDDIYDLVGELAVDKEEAAWNDFGQQLKDTIMDITRRQNIKLVDED